MKANWIGIRIFVDHNETKEEFICNECKSDIFTYCSQVSFLGDHPKECINQDKKHFHKPVALLNVETQAV
jgi:hypothetical protein